MLSMNSYKRRRNKKRKLGNSHFNKGPALQGPLNSKDPNNTDQEEDENVETLISDTDDSSHLIRRKFAKLKCTKLSIVSGKSQILIPNISIERNEPLQCVSCKEHIVKNRIGRNKYYTHIRSEKYPLQDFYLSSGATSLPPSPTISSQEIKQRHKTRLHGHPHLSLLSKYKQKLNSQNNSISSEDCKMDVDVNYDEEEGSDCGFLTNDEGREGDDEQSEWEHFNTSNSSNIINTYINVEDDIYLKAPSLPQYCKTCFENKFLKIKLPQILPISNINTCTP